MKRLTFCFVFGLTFLRSLSADEPDLTGMDVNHDGFIERTEIPPKLLPILSRYASLAKRDLNRPVKIADIEIGRDAYLRQLQGGEAGLGKPAARRHQFGGQAGSHVRPFGVAGMIQGNLTDQVRRTTIKRFQELDTDRNGLISPSERAFEYRERSASWMRGDRNGDGLLTFAEMATAIAAESQRWRIRQANDQSTWHKDGNDITPAHREHARRLMQTHDKNNNRRLDSNEIPQDWKNGDMLKWSDENRDGRITQAELNIGSALWLRSRHDQRMAKQDPNHRHSESLASRIIQKHDTDKDGTLSSWEWRRIGGNVDKADSNGNGTIVEKELSAWFLAQMSSRQGVVLPEGLPNWFLESDLDLDGQVAMAEFVDARNRQQLHEFQSFDRNSDGIVSVAECSQRVGVGKIRYSNDSPMVVEPNGILRSSIFISDEFTIADIDLHVSILKDGDDDLELRLVGPDGTKATLYYTNRRKPWGGGRLFDSTIIDEEAPRSATRLPSPPSHRSFRPQSIGEDSLLSLEAFYGKSSKGPWQLVIANPAQSGGRKAGLLQSWSLLFQRDGSPSR